MRDTKRLYYDWCAQYWNTKWHCSWVLSLFVAVSRRWCTTVSAAGLSTCREWAGEQATENSETLNTLLLLMRFCVWWFSRGVLISKLAAWNKVLSLWCFCKIPAILFGCKNLKGWVQRAMDGYVWLNSLLLNVRFAVQRTPLSYLMIPACGKVDVCLVSAWSILLPLGHRLDQSVSTADRDIRWCTNTSRQCASIHSGLQLLFWWLWLLGFAEMSHFSSIWSLIHSQYLAGPPP